jgi:hypothetical protein
MRHTRLKKRISTIIAILSLVAFSATPVLQAATFQLPEGTEVKVMFNTDTKITSGNTEAGTSLMITLAEPIKLGERVLIAEGAVGKATVTEVEKAKAPGKPGRIVVEFNELGTRGGFKTSDGSPIKLSGTIERVGKGKKLLAFITLIGILLIKGGQGEILANHVYTATIKETVVLQGE